MAKKIFAVGVFLFFIFGVKTCYQQLFCEYVPLLTIEDHSGWSLSDSIQVTPFVSLNGENIICCAIRFSSVRHEIKIHHFSQEVIAKRSDQKINLSHVLTYKDTVNWKRVNDSRIRAPNYAELPEKYKTIKPDREENVFMFYFKATEMLETEEYLLKINMTYTADDLRFDIKKELHFYRSMKWQKINWMT